MRSLRPLPIMSRLEHLKSISSQRRANSSLMRIPVVAKSPIHTFTSPTALSYACFMSSAGMVLGSLCSCLRLLWKRQGLEVSKPSRMKYRYSALIEDSSLFVVAGLIPSFERYVMYASISPLVRLDHFAPSRWVRIHRANPLRSFTYSLAVLWL